MNDTTERKVSMSQEEFLRHCTACGGNWGAMLLTGIKDVFPEYYEAVSDYYNNMDFSGGGIKSFVYLCDWLEEHGVYPVDD